MARKAKDKLEEVTVKALKGFTADFRCHNDFQFEVGKTYEHTGDVAVCSGGFHACDGSPFDVWGYYGPVGDDGRLNRFADVTMTGAVDRNSDGDSKLAAARITIDAEIRLPDFIRRAVSWVIEATRGMGDNPSGDSAKIGSSGDYAQIGSSGHYAKIGSSGDYAQIGSSGHSAKIGSSGDYAQIGSSGDYAQIVAEGNNAVIACAGSGTVTAGPGGAICIPYHDGKRTRFAIGYVGEDGIEAGKAYVAQNGKLVAA